MPTLTTQSIGVAGTHITTPQQQVAQVRASEASAQAGVQKAQNQARAVSNATQVKSDADRTIQEEKRAEGTFADGSDKDSSQQDSEAAPNPKGTFTKVA